MSRAGSISCQKITVDEMSLTSPASAQASQDAILEQVKNASLELGEVLTESTYLATIAVSQNLICLLIVLLIVSLILLIYLGVISLMKAVIFFVIAMIYLIIIAAVFTIYTRDYTRKSISGALLVFNNYVASEDALDTIYNAVLVYHQNL